MRLPRLAFSKSRNDRSRESLPCLKSVTCVLTKLFLRYTEYGLMVSLKVFVLWVLTNNLEQFNRYARIFS